MRFNIKGETKCQNYHIKHLKVLAKSLGYSDYKVNRKLKGNGCRQVSLAPCRGINIVKDGGFMAGRTELPINVIFWGSFSGKYVTSTIVEIGESNTANLSNRKNYFFYFVTRTYLR